MQTACIWTFHDKVLERHQMNRSMLERNSWLCQENNSPTAVAQVALGTVDFHRRSAANTYTFRKVDMSYSNTDLIQTKTPTHFWVYTVWYSPHTNTSDVIPIITMTAHWLEERKSQCKTTAQHLTLCAYPHHHLRSSHICSLGIRHNLTLLHLGLILVTLDSEILAFSHLLHARHPQSSYTW